MKEEREVNAESAASHIRQMRESLGWQILVRHWNGERERIIRDGKKARADNKQVQLWSMLEGFDNAVLMAEKLAVIQEAQEIAGMPED